MKDFEIIVFPESKEKHQVQPTAIIKIGGKVINNVFDYEIKHPVSDICKLTLYMHIHKESIVKGKAGIIINGILMDDKVAKQLYEICKEYLEDNQIKLGGGTGEDLL